MKDLLEKFVIIAKDTENVDASKYRAFKLKQRLMKSYPQLVFCLPKMRNVSEIVYVENLDSSELVEEHMSIKRLARQPGKRDEFLLCLYEKLLSCLPGQFCYIVLF